MSNFSTSDNAIHLSHGRKESRPHSFQQEHVITPCKLNKFHCIFGVQSKWFLANSWFPSLKTHFCHLCVLVCNTSDVYNINLGILQKFGIAAIAFWDIKLFRENISFIMISRGDGKAFLNKVKYKI